MTKSNFLKIFIALIVLSLSGYFLFQLSKSRTYQLFGVLINRVDTQRKVVALTFDDAPSVYSDEVLKILKDKNVKATFYVVGKGIEKYPEQVKNIYQAGHELGNHSYSHQRFLLKSLSFVESEIQKTNMLIRNTGYDGEITFRPPYGKKLIILPWYLSKQNIKSVMVDVEAETYMPNIQDDAIKTQFLIDYTVNNTRPGSIILLHPFCSSCSNTRNALSKIIDQLHGQGYAFATVSELLNLNN